MHANREASQQNTSGLGPDPWFFGIFIAFAIALFVFAPAGGKIFGVAALCLSCLLALREYLVRRFRYIPFPRAAVRFSSIVREASTRFGHRYARIAVAIVGASMFLAAWRFLAGDPVEMSVLLAGSGAILWFWCVASGRTAESAPRKQRLVAPNLIGGALGLAAVAGLTWVILRFAENFPLWDEYWGTLLWLTEFKGLHGAAAMDSLISPHNGVHRIVPSRLAAWTDYRLNGELNFVHLVWLSFCFELATVFILYKSVSESVRTPLVFAPALLVLFQPQYFHLTLTGFSVPHLSCFFFSALTLFLLSRGRAGVYPAGVTLIAATYSFATGVFVGLIGFAYLLESRRYRDAAVWLLPFGFSVISFFVGLTLAGAGAGLLSKFWYVLEFMGSAATLGFFADPEDAWKQAYHGLSHPPLLWAARVVGIALLLAFLYVTARLYWRRNPTVYGLLLLILVGAIAAAELRGMESEIPVTPFMSRYAINSVFAIALMYLALAELHSNAFARSGIFTLATAALFCAVSYSVALPHIRNHSAYLRHGILQMSNASYQTFLPTHRLSTTYFNALFSALFTRGVNSGVYNPPIEAAAIDLLVKGERSDANRFSTQPSSWRLIEVGENERTYTFYIGANDEVNTIDETSRPPGILLSAASGGSFLFPTVYLGSLPGRMDVYQDQSPPGASHLACILKSDLPPGAISVWLADAHGDVAAITTTGTLLPVRWTPTSLLRNSSFPVVTHHINERVRKVADPVGKPRRASQNDGVNLTPPDPSSIEAIFHVGTVRGENPEVVWHLAPVDSHGSDGLRLIVGGDWAAIEYYWGSRWRELTRLQVTREAWNWALVACDGTRVALFSCALDPQTNQVGPLFVAQAANLVSPIRGARTLSIGGGESATENSAIDVFEVRTLAGAIDDDAAVRSWPPFTTSGLSAR